MFARYLTNRAASQDAVRHYVGAAKAHGLACDFAFTDFDRVSLALARRGPLGARCADAFCAVFHRRGALRRKIVSIAAIIENQPPASEIFDAPQAAGRRAGALVRLAGHGLVFLIAMLVGAITLSCARLIRLGRA